MPLRHHSLVVWQRADDLFIELHKLTRKSFPSHERFELGSQTRRAAFSVAANIIEGCAREHKGERLQFLNISRASLAELGYCLHVARRLECISDTQFDSLDSSVRRVGAALSGYIKSLRNGRTQ
jgi:four helix bundle protein